MAMACAAGALAVSPSAGVLASASTRCDSSVSQKRRRTTSRAVVVKCARQDDVHAEERNVSRREVFSLATLSVLLSSADMAQAKDVPLFGFRKQLEKAEKAVAKAEKAVETEVKELAKKGEKELEAVSASLTGIDVGIDVGASVSGLSPIIQAGGVVGVEVVAVLVAASVVNGLVSVPSK